MAYGESGIPHHETLDPRGAHERHMRSAGTGDGGVGHGMSYLGVLCKGCLTLECYANSGVGHSMSGGGYLGTLFTLELAHSEVVAVAVHWQQKTVLVGRLADWQRQGLGPWPRKRAQRPRQGAFNWRQGVDSGRGKEKAPWGFQGACNYRGLSGLVSVCRYLRGPIEPTES